MGFFTKNPKESVYIIESHDKAEEILLPNMDYRNLFGIVRKGRAQGVEFGKVLSQIPEEAWESCENIDCSIIKERISRYSNQLKGLFFSPIYLRWHQQSN